MGHRQLRFIVVLACALPWVSGISAHAEFASYVQHACSLPSGAVAATDGFTAATSGGAIASDGCSQGQGLVLGIPAGAGATASGAWQYVPPDGTRIGEIGYLRLLSGFAGPGVSSGLFYEDGAATCAASTHCPARHRVVVDDTPQAFAGALACESTPCGPDDEGGQVSLQEIAIRLVDPSPPRFAFPPTGSMFGSEGPLAGVVKTDFEASDEGGGIYEAVLLVDGLPLVRSGACEKPFTARVPCPLRHQGSILLDTTRIADGEHSLSLVVYDATEQNSAVFGPTVVRVSNRGATSGSSVASPNGASASRQARLLGIGVGKSVRQPLGGSKAVRGRLVDAGGQPIAGAAVAVYGRADAPGTKERLLTQASTDDSGQFRFQIPPGPSRRLSVRYRAYSSDKRDAATWSFTTRVAARLTLKPSHRRLANGETLVLKAVLPGARIRPRSADIAFQVRIGSQWRTFAKRPLGKSGTAAVKHRFRVTFQRLTYRFRAVTLGRRTFPYENGGSPVVAVRLN